LTLTPFGTMVLAVPDADKYAVSVWLLIQQMES
jgi:hypothetical protein